jgi:hypothetical protein
MLYKIVYWKSDQKKVYVESRHKTQKVNNFVFSGIDMCVTCQPYQRRDAEPEVTVDLKFEKDSSR